MTDRFVWTSAELEILNKLIYDGNDKYCSRPPVGLTTIRLIYDTSQWNYDNLAQNVKYSG